MEIQHGFLLSYIRYGDQDAVLNAFTQEKGYQSFFIKGLYSPKNKKKAFLQPLNYLEFNVRTSRQSAELLQTNKIELISILGCDNEHIYTVIFFIADFLNQNLKNEGDNEVIFLEIEKFIFELQRKNFSSHLIFLIRILKINGLAPLENHHEFLNPEDGSFQNVQSHKEFSGSISSFWKEILTSEAPYLIKVSNHLRKDLLHSILIYYQLHYPGFKIPISLEVIQQLF